MKRIRKSQPEPQELAAFKARFAAAPRPPTWTEFKGDPRRREPVKRRLRDDQRGLCAYCENRLVPGEESVEHFVPRSADHTRELDWSNLLLCCSGGAKPLAEDLPDAASRVEPSCSHTCGHAKLGNPQPVLDPLGIPAAPCLFRFSSETGAMSPDEARCQAAGVGQGLARQTILVLGLNSGRLNRARRALMDELLRQFAAGAIAPSFSTERARQIAESLIPAEGGLPAFFTTVRWFLGAGAEAHLLAIGFDG